MSQGAVRIDFSKSKKYTVSHGEVTELAEGARLLSECTRENGTQGSNPCLSAITPAGFHRIRYVPSTFAEEDFLK